MPNPVIILLEPFGGSIRRHNPALPFIFYDDAAVTRGDGVFETLLIRGGRAVNIERHAERFRASALLMDMPEPSVDYWRRATEEGIAAWQEQVGDGDTRDAKCVWTYTRGRAATGFPSAWLSITTVGSEQLRQREKGVKVMSTPRGWSINTELPGVKQATSGEVKAVGKPVAPWLTVGAKTLNYAANMAALRHARKQGFDDVIYIEGTRVLEGATSTIVAVTRAKKLRTPRPGGDVLPGTTQAALFDYAAEHGWRVKAKELSLHDLCEAESVWLVSSVRVAARITHIDHHELPEPSGSHVKKIRRLIDAALG